MLWLLVRAELKTIRGSRLGISDAMVALDPKHSQWVSDGIIDENGYVSEVMKTSEVCRKQSSHSAKLCGTITSPSDHDGLDANGMGGEILNDQ